MRKNEQCVKRFLAGVLCAAFALAGMTACGNTKGAEGSVIAVSKDGTVTDTIREPFDQDYYSQQELQDEVLKAVASYNSGMGNEAITVSKVQVDDGVTDVEMKYRSAEDYAAFNRETFLSEPRHRRGCQALTLIRSIQQFPIRPRPWAWQSFLIQMGFWY